MCATLVETLAIFSDCAEQQDTIPAEYPADVCQTHEEQGVANKSLEEQEMLVTEAVISIFSNTSLAVPPQSMTSKLPVLCETQNRR